MKTTAFGVLVLAIAASLAAAQTQSVTPQFQNAKVETRRGSSIDREIANAAPGGSTDPVWVGWRVPMIDGDRDLCSWYNDRYSSMRAMYLDEGGVFITDTGMVSSQRPQIAQPKGPIPLEGGTRLVVLARIISGKIERIRTAGDDCPMDAGGRTVIWLDSVTPAESLRFLADLAQAGPTDRTLYDSDRNNAQSAVRAIGYHRDPGADAILDRIATDHRDSNVRRSAASALASFRGAPGVATITRLLASSRSSDERQALTRTLGQSHDPSAVQTLRRLITDEDPRVRADAAYYFVIRGGSAVMPEAVKIIANDRDDNVRRRTVSGIGRLPSDAGVAQLLELARGKATDPVVRKEAVAALGQSKDPRAVAFMEELIKR